MNRDIDPHKMFEPADWTAPDYPPEDYPDWRCEHCLGGPNAYHEGEPTADHCGDCMQCGEPVCVDCAPKPCGVRMVCHCGRIVLGSEVHWELDGDAFCDACDPLVECEATYHDGDRMVRERQATVVDLSSGTEPRGWDTIYVCDECRGESEY